MVMLRAALPVLVRVIAWAGLVVLMIWVANVRLVGESDTWGCRPVPVRLTDCGLFPALSVVTSALLSAPMMVGLKVTVIEQL